MGSNLASVSFRRFVAPSLRRLKRRARAFGQPFGLPDLLLFAWPLRRRSGANAEGGPGGAEGRKPGVKRSRQEKGHPSSAPSAHPCAEGSRESVGVFGQAIPGLSKTLAASLRPTLRADRPPPAAPQGPPGRARAPARKSQSEKREARSEKREAAMWIGWALAHRGLDARACPSAPKPQRRAGPESPGPALRDLRAFTAPVLGASRGRAAHTRASASLPFGASRASFGLIHSRRVNQARATAPTLNTVSPGTRIHTSIWMIGCCIRSAERAYQ